MSTPFDFPSSSALHQVSAVLVSVLHAQIQKLQPEEICSLSTTQKETGDLLRKLAPFETCGLVIVCRYAIAGRRCCSEPPALRNAGGVPGQ